MCFCRGSLNAMPCCAQDVSHSIPSLDVKGEEYRLVNNVAAYAEPFEVRGC